MRPVFVASVFAAGACRQRRRAHILGDSRLIVTKPRRVALKRGCAERRGCPGVCNSSAREFWLWRVLLLSF